jgi:hypothetical protein
MVTTPKDVYRKYIEFEERAAALYLELASHFHDNSELSSFWLDMALHEKQHAGLLQFCLRDNLFVSDLPDSGEIEKLTTFFERLEKRAADPNLTVEQAFGLAIELEASEINAIYCHLTTKLHSSLYLLRRKIAITVPTHVDDLIATARKFGVAETSLEELIRAKQHCPTL